MPEKQNQHDSPESLPEIEELDRLDAVEFAGGEFALEDILEEYGAGRKQHIMSEVDQALQAQSKTSPTASAAHSASAAPSVSAAPPAAKTPQMAPQSSAAVKTKVPQPETPPAQPVQSAPKTTGSNPNWLQQLQAELPPEPKPLSMDELVGQTVDAVLTERERRKDRRPGLFSKQNIAVSEEQRKELLEKRPKELREERAVESSARKERSEERREKRPETERAETRQGKGKSHEEQPRSDKERRNESEQADTAREEQRRPKKQPLKEPDSPTSKKEEAEEIPEEPPLEEAAETARLLHRWCRKPLVLVTLLALIPVTLLALDTFGIETPFSALDTRAQNGILALILLALCTLGNNVFTRGFSALLQGRCTGELLTALSVVITLLDCIATVILPERGEAAPYAAAAGLGFAFSLWGGSRLGLGGYETFRVASMENPPWILSESSAGACKQSGDTKGFFSCANRLDVSSWWQAGLLPFVLIATLVFAVLSTIAGQQQPQNFLLNWSALLTAAASYALPLSYALPFARVSKRMGKSGCAVAGYDGAELLTHRNAIVLTDTDLFPTGSISIKGVKTYGETAKTAASYAATLIRASGCVGLKPLFDDLLRSEGGFREELHKFYFYKEGGFSGEIRGSTVLLGSASFMRKMSVRLPSDVKLQTGLYMSVNQELIAIFAVQYQDNDNMDWALRLLKRNHITPILATRDPNITPSMLKRKFGRGIQVSYPKLSDRIALSEGKSGTGLPRALLYREGLLPYTEAIVGSHRLVHSVRRGTFLSLLSSISGTLLAFYLTFQSQFSLLTPWNLLIFQLLWVLPILLLTDWSGRY